MSKARVTNAVKIIAHSVHAEKCVAHKDGTYSIKHSFYYSLGGNSDQWAAKVQEASQNIATVDVRTSSGTWPALSFWVARVRVTDEAGVVADAEKIVDAWGATFSEAAAEARAHFAGS